VAETMKETLRHIAKQSGMIFPFRWLNRLTYPILLPFYHVVSNEKLPHIRNYEFRNEQQFIDELDFLLRLFKPVELHELLKPETKGMKVFHLSFDDGLRQCFDVIAPILIRKGIPATFFVNPAFVDNRQLFHRYKASLLVNHILEHPADLKHLEYSGYDTRSVLAIPYHQTAVLDNIALKMGISWTSFLDNYKPYMTKNEIKKLVSQGFTIGAHSWDHPEFWLLNEPEQLNQVVRSVEWVSENFNPKLKVFAFPYTDDGITSSLLTQITENMICDLTFGTAGVKSDSVPGHLQRFPCETQSKLEDTLQNEMAYHLFRRIFGKSVVKHL
jgi:peptidoglycan/xylan/chitin deacetylase (PgdA/CDA1 family)